MSQICKYYLRGICKYGSRCHFLHEDNTYKYQDVYADQSYNSYRNYSPNYGYRNSYGNHSNKDYSQNYPSRRQSQNYSYRDTDTSNDYWNKSYDRYHVDNRRYNQTEIKHVNELPSGDILDLIKRELKEFEERHVWPLTVIAPLKDLGNIPGFKDFSPEEIRYQYYEARQSNNILNFNQSLNQIKENVIRYCQIFKLNNDVALDIVRKMQQRSTNQNVEEMATDFESGEASTFSFDLRTLPKQRTDPNKTSNLFNSAHEVNSGATVTSSVFNFSTPPSGNIVSGMLNNEPSFSSSSVFGTNPASQFNAESMSKLNSFSFNLNNLVSNQNGVTPSIVFGTVIKNEIDNNNVYSKLNELSPNIREAFQAKTFKFGQIPLIPPPKELCSN